MGPEPPAAALVRRLQRTPPIEEERATEAGLQATLYTHLLLTRYTSKTFPTRMSSSPREDKLTELRSLAIPTRSSMTSQTRIRRRYKYLTLHPSLRLFFLVQAADTGFAGGSPPQSEGLASGIR